MGGVRGFFKSTINCLSALIAAERYDDVLTLLALEPYPMWHYRQYGVKALSAQGKKAEAIRFAEEGRGLNDSPIAIARAARDYAEEDPPFAVGAGLLALHWLVQGHGYEITGADVWDAYRATLAAAARHDSAAEVKERIRELVAAETAGGRFVTKVLGRELGL